MNCWADSLFVNTTSKSRRRRSLSPSQLLRAQNACVRVETLWVNSRELSSKPKESMSGAPTSVAAWSMHRPFHLEEQLLLLLLPPPRAVYDVAFRQDFRHDILCSRYNYDDPPVTSTGSFVASLSLSPPSSSG